MEFDTKQLLAAEKLRQFEHSALRQEAIANFILSHMQMARDLRQMCDMRRYASHPVDTLEDVAAYMEAKLCEGFEEAFGHPLFPKEDVNA